MSNLSLKICCLSLCFSVAAFNTQSPNVEARQISNGRIRIISIQPDSAQSLSSSPHKILVQCSDLPRDEVSPYPLQPSPQPDGMEQQIQQQQQQWQQQQQQWQKQRQQWQQQQQQWQQRQQQRQQEWRQQQTLP